MKQMLVGKTLPFMPECRCATYKLPLLAAHAGPANYSTDSKGRSGRRKERPEVPLETRDVASK